MGGPPSSGENTVSAEEGPVYHLLDCKTEQCVTRIRCSPPLVVPFSLCSWMASWWPSIEGRFLAWLKTFFFWNFQVFEAVATHGKSGNKNDLQLEALGKNGTHAVNAEDEMVNRRLANVSLRTVRNVLAHTEMYALSRTPLPQPQDGVCFLHLKSWNDVCYVCDFVLEQSLKRDAVFLTVQTHQEYKRPPYSSWMPRGNELGPKTFQKWIKPK